MKHFWNFGSIYVVICSDYFLYSNLSHPESQTSKFNKPNRTVSARASYEYAALSFMAQNFLPRRWYLI